jgi:hypothetical protein
MRSWCMWMLGCVVPRMWRDIYGLILFSIVVNRWVHVDVGVCRSENVERYIWIDFVFDCG